MSKLEKMFETSYTRPEVLQELFKDAPSWEKERRTKAYQNFLELPIDQDTLFYKYTNFKDFNPEGLTPVWETGSTSQVDLNSLSIEDIQPSLVEDSGKVVNHAHKEIEEKGGFFGPLSELIQKDEDLARKIVQKANVSDRFDKLGELAKAFSTSTIILYVPRRVVIEEPLMRRIILSGDKDGGFSELIVYLEEEASARYIEYYGQGRSNVENQMYVTSQTIVLDDNAQLKMVSVQDWNDHLVHIGAKYGHIGPYAKLFTLQQFQGSNISRFNSGMKLVGQGSEGYDLFNSFGNHKQRFDFKSELEHIARDTIGQTHSRTVMMNKAESILRGLIHIPKSGINADSYLTSNGLTIGKGKVIAVPALKIDQNEVMAAHAASVEPLNLDKLFYITSRGIPLEEAKELMVKGYFAPVTRILKDEKLEAVANFALSKKWEESKE